MQPSRPSVRQSNSCETSATYGFDVAIRSKRSLAEHHRQLSYMHPWPSSGGTFEPSFVNFLSVEIIARSNHGVVDGTKRFIAGILYFRADTAYASSTNSAEHPGHIQSYHSSGSSPSSSYTAISRTHESLNISRELTHNSASVFPSGSISVT